MRHTLAATSAWLPDRRGGYELHLGRRLLRAIPGRLLQAMFLTGVGTDHWPAGALRGEGAEMSSETSTGRRTSPWASGSILFAAGMLVITGVLQVFVGTTALTVDRIYDDTPQYLYAFDLTAWGWAQLLTGILSVAAGYGALRGLTWARVVGISLAALSVLVQFMFAPHYPIWSLLVIALDVLIIWCLSTYSRDDLWRHQD